jgi:glutathione S-transferase
MSKLILHHYDFSNYSEKVRLVLGHKGLAWQSVTIPAYAPKPDYTPLTAGYRRTPALQIGADVYCDTRLIIDVIDTLAPAPTLYPGNNRAHTKALCEALVGWVESSLMRPLALYITGLNAEQFSDEFHADRARLHGKPQPSVAQVKASAAKYWSEVELQLRVLEDMLNESAGFVLDAAPSLADFALYEAPWFLRTIGGDVAVPKDLPNLSAWSARVAAIGHGQVHVLEATAALEIALAATPLPLDVGAAQVPAEFALGEQVTVVPFDQDSPATGRLAYIDAQRITLATEDTALGLLHVHFPRLGYRLRRLRT